jgi:hypothetical protein
MPDSQLSEVSLDFVQADKELDEYKNWLDSNAEFSERRVVEYLKTRKDLCLLIQLAGSSGRGRSP